jgi:hypothetical protein
MLMRRHDRLARVLLFGALGLGAAFSAGCSEEFSDAPFGVLDLASFYDGGTSTDPAAGVPTEIPATTGYIGGQAAEFYDFGAVPAITSSTGQPIAVRVQPMYFFFDGADQPLFSRPVREQRDGTEWMKGGKNVLNPNPKDYCAGVMGDRTQCEMENAVERQKSYPLRRRDYWVDPIRGVADYQRPIVAVAPGDDDPPRRQYTGLWEIVEVKVPDGYEVDSIKQASTLEKAIASGKFKARSTGKVINCPIVDERTAVPRGITARSIFHPRIELWFRRQMAFCFLANGWETLGNPNGELYFANQDAERFDTFDVSRVQVGKGIELAVNVGRAYQPATYVIDPELGTRKRVNVVSGNTIVDQKPRHAGNDPGGYTPMRWLFDAPAPIDYQPGTWKAVADLDVARTIGSPVVVKNLAVRGVAVACSHPKVPNTNPPNQCGRVISESPVKIDPSGDPACNAERGPGDPPLECNPETCFCDAPFVGYGQACGPGIAQCNPKGDSFSPKGYRCFPPWGGFCQKACDPAASNTYAAENAGKEATQLLDSRCGEPATPGFVCFASIATCIKFCDENVKNPNQCSVQGKVGEEARELQAGQTCQNFGIAVCAWPDTHTPEPFPIPQ